MKFTYYSYFIFVVSNFSHLYFTGHDQDIFFFYSGIGVFFWLEAGILNNWDWQRCIETRSNYFLTIFLYQTLQMIYSFI